MAGHGFSTDLGLGWLCHLQPTTPDGIVGTLSLFPPLPIHKVQNRLSFPNCAFEHHCTGARGLYYACPKIGSVPSMTKVLSDYLRLVEQPTVLAY